MYLLSSLTDGYIKAMIDASAVSQALAVKQVSGQENTPNKHRGGYPCKKMSHSSFNRQF
jgi:hypothetical protein